MLSTSDSIPGTINGAFDYTITIVENSYAVDSNGDAMPLTIEGGGNCDDLLLASGSTDIDFNSGSVTLTIAPLVEQTYVGCMLMVEDHAANTGTLTLP